MQQRFPSLDSYINESKLIEKNLKPITKKTWDKSRYDQKCELLQQVVKDIDDVDKYVEKPFDELPDWIIAGMYESRLDESLDDWDPNHNYGVFYIGGSIGDKKDGITKRFGSNVGKLYYTFATADEAKKHAAESRKRLSPGERKYYGMTYKSAPLTPADKKQIADKTGKPINEGFLTDFIVEGDPITIMDMKGTIGKILLTDSYGQIYRFNFISETGEEYVAMNIGDRFIISK